MPAVSDAERELRVVPASSPASFDDFVRDHQVGLVRYAALLAGSAAHGEDLVQEVLVRIYPRWDGLVRGNGDLLAYVRRSVTNEFLSWKRRWSTRHIRLADVGELERVPDESRDDRPDQMLWRRLQQLPAQQRAAVVLRYYEDLGDAEIADVLGCRPATVRSHISRGLAALRAGTDDSDLGDSSRGERS